MNCYECINMYQESGFDGTKEDLKTFDLAISCPQYSNWQEVMKDELDSV